jgi:Domain of unknown function (DUF5753)
LERQGALVRQEWPLLHVVVHSDLPHSSGAGGAKVMKRQLERVVECASDGHAIVYLAEPNPDNDTFVTRPFTLVTTRSYGMLAYVGGCEGMAAVHEPRHVRWLDWHFGLLNSYSLTPDRSLDVIKQAAGEL